MAAPVPTWQIAVSAGLATLFAVGSLYVAGRAFRLGMLRYGLRLSLREILPALRSKSDAKGGANE